MANAVLGLWYCCSLIFMWVLRIETQVLTLYGKYSTNESLPEPRKFSSL